MAEQVTWDLFQEVVATHLGLEIGAASKETHLYNDLGLDSLGVVSLGIKLHSVFKAKVPMSAVSQIATIGDMFRITVEYTGL